MADARFDSSYYERYYADPDTRVGSEASTARLVRFVCSYLDYLGVELREVLDFGCGVGLWRAPLRHCVPGLTYHGVEFSAHLCERHGWVRGSVVDHDHGRAVDLVVCQGVLQYLPDAQARRAIRNLARHAGQALYLEALTKGDWLHNCDQSVTDGDVYLRTAAWYRDALAPHFDSCGGGLFLPKDSPVVLFELEQG
ncbi:class I SAM-dependent methyltransferase [Enhygromyxa salina]|nr:class I SAM-dependent methyltransferase [Enhygromyxa salina]